MRPALTIYIVFLIILISSILYAGPVDQVIFGHDIYCLIEGGWKIYHGNIPYIDFSTLLGPLPHLILASGFLLTGPSVNAFPVSTVLGLVPISMLAWLVFSRQMNDYLCLFACTYLAFVWAAPFPLHHDYYYLSYAMNYNRESYVILSLLMIHSLTNKNSDYFLSGILIGLLLFFKIPYFVAGVVFIAYRVLFDHFSIRSFLLFAGGFLAVAFPVSIYLNGTTGLIAMITDFYVTGQTRTSAMIWEGLSLVFSEIKATGFIVAFILFCLDRARRAQPSTTDEFSFIPTTSKIIFEAAVVFTAAFITEMGSSPQGWLFDIPLVSVYALVLLSRLISTTPYPHSISEGIFPLLCMICCLTLVLPSWNRSFWGLYLATCNGNSKIVFSNLTSIDSPRFHHIQFFGSCGDYPPGVTYASKINDGLHLIRRHPELDHAYIASLDFSDALSFPLGKPSPPHMPLYLIYGYNVNETIYPKPERIFADCGALMIPKYPDTTPRTIITLLKEYKHYLDSNFKEIDQSNLWILYQKK